jgi:hypothetical protein
LAAYCLSEFHREPPPEWEKRLREVSPIVSDLDHLRFRWFEGHPSWNHPERGQWTLYAARPIRLVEEGRAEQFKKHWSELPKTEQVGRRAMVSDYQHFMWHAQGLYVRPFLILQGEWGGTPAKYSETEIAFLDSSDCISEPFPIGFFPACQFDERVVKTIAMRDRLLKCANDYAETAKLDTPEGLKAADDAAQYVRRETYLDTWKIMIQPSVEFMQHFLKRSENRETLPAAPTGLANTISQWREHYMEHGVVLGALPAIQRRVHLNTRHLGTRRHDSLN